MRSYLQRDPIASGIQWAWLLGGADWKGRDQSWRLEGRLCRVQVRC